MSTFGVLLVMGFMVNVVLDVGSSESMSVGPTSLPLFLLLLASAALAATAAAVGLMVNAGFALSIPVSLFAWEEGNPDDKFIVLAVLADWPGKIT